MNFYFIILLNFQLTLSSINLDIFDYYGSPNTNLILGNSTFLENFDLDMSIDYLWVSSMKYTNEADHTIKLIEKNITLEPHKDASFLHYETNIIFPKTNITLKDFPFYLTTDLFWIAYDSIPLAYKFQNESTSIIHTLFKKGIIERKSLTFIFPDKNSDNGTVIIGNSIDFFNQQKLNTSCQVNPNYTTWSCNLLQAQINRRVFENTFHSIFQANTKAIKAPYYFMVEMNNSIFQYYYDEKICEYQRSWNSDNIECECNRLKNNISVSLIFDGSVFSFNNRELFIEKDNNKCIFMFEPNLNNNETWIIGMNLYKRYITDFDYEKGRISFYKKVHTKKNNRILKMITIINLIINIINIIVISSIKENI